MILRVLRMCFVCVCVALGNFFFLYLLMIGSFNQEGKAIDRKRSNKK